jgi:hypothetical protein
VGGDKGAGVAYRKHNDDDVIVVVVPRPSALHRHHVAHCDMAQLARGVVRGPGPWRVPVVVFGACWSSFVGRCVWLSFVVGHSRSFVALLSCRARWWWVEESNSNVTTCDVGFNIVETRTMISRDHHAQICSVPFFITKVVVYYLAMFKTNAVAKSSSKPILLHPSNAGMFLIGKLME